MGYEIMSRLVTAKMVAFRSIFLVTSFLLQLSFALSRLGNNFKSGFALLRFVVIISKSDFVNEKHHHTFSISIFNQFFM